MISRFAFRFLFTPFLLLAGFFLKALLFLAEFLLTTLLLLCKFLFAFALFLQQFLQFLGTLLGGLALGLDILLRLESLLKFVVDRIFVEGEHHA